MRETERPGGMEPDPSMEGVAPQDARERPDVDAPQEATDGREARVESPSDGEQSDLTAPADNAQEAHEARIQELAELYLDDLQEASEFAPDSIDPSSWEPRSPEENAEARREYNKERAGLIRAWEQKHGQEWPRYAQDVSGPPSRRAGMRMDCHHIQPLGAGGANSVENIMPLHVDHHGPGAANGVHRKGAPLSRLVDALKEG